MRECEANLAIFRRHAITVRQGPGAPVPPPASAFEIPLPHSYEHALDRALEYFNEAQLRVALFIEHEPGTTPLEQNPKGEMAVWYRVLRQPGPEIILPIIDCIHSLRQSLDYLAYRLAIAVNGSDPPSNTETSGFPITDRESQFTGSLGQKIGPPKRISSAMRTALQAAQPYEGGNAKLLGLLRDLDNFAKHRFPPIITVGGVVSDIDIKQLSGRWIREPRLGPVEDGTEIMRFIPEPDSYMDMGFRCVNQVAFAKGDPGQGNDPLHVLWMIRQYLYTDLIPSFEALPEFPT